MNDEHTFAKAIELSANQREKFLDDVYRDRPDERRRLAAMILAHEQSDNLLDTEAMVAMEKAIPECKPTTNIGDFEIIRELGRGGMGVVYEARQKSLKRKVALKILSSGLGLSSKAILRFRREAEAAGKLHHTNIIPIYTTGEDKGIHYYAMELIDGPSLDAVIRSLRDSEDSGEERSRHLAQTPKWVKETVLFQGPGGDRGRVESPGTSNASVEASARSTISSGSAYFDQVASMIADVAEALDHAHEHGVVHRDIKPSNLMLGPDGRLSINDFGLARMLEQPGMTMSGEFVGSPLYMSPEQITAGRVTIDHRTDIYSLGATLYELLVLCPPFPGQTRDQVLSQILHKDAVSTRKLNRRVPVDLDTICMKAIDKDPDRRYQTAGQLADDLRRYVNRHAISARRIGPIGSVIKYARRNPAAAALIFFILLTFVGVVVAYRTTQVRERQDQIDQLGRDLLYDLFRGQTNTGDSLINRAEDLRASPEWLSFYRGLRELFRQDYDDAKSYFERVLEKQPNSVAAKSLLAVAHMWSGNEYTYFKLLSEIQPDDAESFEEKFFLGYANHWGDCLLSYKLLSEANTIRPGLQYVVFLRGVAARGHASIALADLDEKKRYIDLALSDMEDAEKLMEKTPLILKELAIAYLHRASIYKRLASIETVNRDSYLMMVDESHKQALALLPQLRASQEAGDSQYAIVMLLSELGTSEDLCSFADQWQRDGIGSPYAANFLAQRFAALKDYGRANYWLAQAKQSRPDHLNVDTFVKIVDPKRPETLRDLTIDARQRVSRKINSGETQNILFDVFSLLLLGDRSQLHCIDDDRLDDVILDGKLYQPVRDYFCGEGKNKIDADQLVDRCGQTPAPNASLMHAHFYLGVEAIADHRDDDAERHFHACREGGEFMFTVYFLSDILLQHRKHWDDWRVDPVDLGNGRSRRPDLRTQ